MSVAILFLFDSRAVRKEEARRLLAIFIPDVKGHVLSNFETAGPLQCKLTLGAVLSQLREVWFLAHLLGW